MDGIVVVGIDLAIIPLYVIPNSDIIIWYNFRGKVNCIVLCAIIWRRRKGVPRYGMMEPDPFGSIAR